MDWKTHKEARKGKKASCPQALKLHTDRRVPTAQVLKKPGYHETEAGTRKGEGTEAEAKMARPLRYSKCFFPFCPSFVNSLALFSYVLAVWKGSKDTLLPPLIFGGLGFIIY